MQGKKLLLNVIGSLAILGMASPVQASMSVPMGWYVEGNIGSSRLQNLSYQNASLSSAGMGENIDIGYKFMPYVAAEVGYTHYPNTRIKVNGVKAGENKYYALDIAGKAILPIAASGFELFAKLGIQQLYAKTRVTNSTLGNQIGLSKGSTHDTGPYMGVGGAYSFLPELSGNIQWTRAKGNHSTGDLDLLSVGLTFTVD
jgi:hypothetical protein